MVEGDPAPASGDGTWALWWTGRRSTPVWVQLELVYPHPSSAPQTAVGHGLELRGRIPGDQYSWVRSTRGMWMAICSFEIRYADGRDDTYPLENQLVPGYAIKPRGDTDQS